MDSEPVPPESPTLPESPRGVALSALGSSIDYLPRVRAALARTVSLLRSGRIEEGNQLYAQLLDALGVVVYAISAAASQIGPAARSLEGVSAEAEECVEQLLVAQERRDWIRVADALEYEMDLCLVRWDEQIREVRQRTGEDDHAEFCG